MPTQRGLGASASRLARPITAPGGQRRLLAAPGRLVETMLVETMA